MDAAKRNSVKTVAACRRPPRGRTTCCVVGRLLDRRAAVSTRVYAQLRRGTITALKAAQRMRRRPTARFQHYENGGGDTDLHVRLCICVRTFAGGRSPMADGTTHGPPRTKAGRKVLTDVAQKRTSGACDDDSRRDHHLSAACRATSSTPHANKFAPHAQKGRRAKHGLFYAPRAWRPNRSVRIATCRYSPVDTQRTKQS
jgi:hypothetical protein